MPIYAVKCKKCGKEKDVLVNKHTDELPKCEECGGEVKRIFSTFAFKIKGYSYKNNYEEAKK